MGKSAYRWGYLGQKPKFERGFISEVTEGLVQGYAENVTLKNKTKEVVEMGDAVRPERLRDIEIFQGLSDEECEMVAKVCRQEIYEEGSVIFNEGERSERIYIVESGRIVCESEVAPGKRVIVGDEKKGGIFGWSALVSPYRCTATARTTQRATVIAIDGRQLQELCSVYSDICAKVMQHMVRVLARRLEALRSYVAEVLHYSQG